MITMIDSTLDRDLNILADPSSTRQSQKKSLEKLTKDLLHLEQPERTNTWHSRVLTTLLKILSTPHEQIREQTATLILNSQ